MLEKFKQIRIYVNAGPGHGSSAANLHLLRWIWSQGFTGLVDIIYDDAAAPKVKVVFDLPDHFFAGAIHSAREGQVQFISVTQYLEIRDVLPEADFGLKATSLTGIYTDIAHFLKAQVVMAFSPFQAMGGTCAEGLSASIDHYLVHRNSSAITWPCDIKSLPIRYPAPTMTDALALLRQAKIDNPASMRLHNLSQLLESVVRGDVIAWPIYGLHKNFKLPVEDILLKLVMTIHVLHKKNRVTKPVVMMLFNNLPQEIFTQIQAMREKLSIMYPDNGTIPRFIKDLVVSLKALSILDINAANMSEALAHSGLSNATMINIGRTEATIFEALLTHVSDFILPPLIEGANAGNLLRNEGLAAFSLFQRGCRLPFTGSFTEVTADRVTQFINAANCILSSPLQLEPASLAASSLDIRNLVTYIRAANDPLSVLRQHLTVDPAQQDRFTAGIQFMLAKMQLPTTAGLTEAMQQQLLGALEQRDVSTINAILGQYDITQWHDLASRRFLWTLLTKGHWHVFKRLTSTQLNQTIIHIPFTALGSSYLSGLISHNNIEYGNAYHDVAFLLSDVVASIQRIRAGSVLQKYDYILLMVLNQEKKALSLSLKQKYIQPFVEACVEARRVYLLDELPSDKILPALYNISTVGLSTIFTSITPDLLHAWKESNVTHLETACSDYYVASLLLNPQFSELIKVLGNISLSEKFIFPGGQLFENESQTSIDSLIEKISFVLTIATEEQKRNILQSVVLHSNIHLSPEACATLTQRFELPFNLPHDDQHLFHEKIRPDNFVRQLTTTICTQLSSVPELDHFIENSFRRNECEKLIGLRQQCFMNTTQLLSYISHCEAAAPVPEHLISSNHTNMEPLTESPSEHSPGIFSQLDSDYPNYYAFGLSFIKSMLETSMVQNQLCSVRQAQILVSFCMIVLGAMFEDWTFILNGFISIILTCLLPKQTVWPIALVLTSIVRDVCQGEALIASLVTNAQRALTGVAGSWSGKRVVTWFRGSCSDGESAQGFSDLSACGQSVIATAETTHANKLD